jgi:ABC-2 type transport system ATP-binding protein
MIADQPIVEAIGLSKRFGTHLAVDSVSFSVARGEVFGFLGPNGCGKTTTIRMLCGILQPTSGSGLLMGHDCWRDAPAVKRKLGYMSQRFALYDELTVDENLAFYGEVYGLAGSSLASRIHEFAEQMGLTSLRSARASALATGLRQRLSLGCATLHRPPVVFLDEPTSGVDPAARRDFWDLIYEFARNGAAVFVTTHYMDEAEYCHRLALMHAGTLIAIGTPDEMRARVGGFALEFDATPVQAAIAALERVPGLVAPTPFGSAVRVYLPPTLGVGVVESALRSAVVSYGEISVMPPSLEDVFTVLLG